jgi:ABC-2 type transport system permease protein
MFSRDSAFLYTLLDDPLWFVAGVRLPLFALPIWVKAIGLAFPLTTSLTVLRGALLDGQTVTGLLGPLAWLAGLTVALFALAAGLLRVGEAHAQRQGSFQMF